MTVFNFIKSNVSIFDTINEYTTLRKAGTYWKARCPFHHEKTASFTVSPHKDIFYCFGCHVNGDVISFIAKMENCSQIEAAKLLADRNNLELPKDISFDHNEENIEQKEAYFNTCKNISLWCHDQLKKSPSVVAYLQKRGIDAASIEKYTIGYMPGGMQSIRTFTHEMQKQSILIQDLINANFLTQGKKVVYSPFEERIIFPIQDHLGRFCGFGGRTFKVEDTRPKYYNSRENDYFIKGSLLFGLPQAKKAIQKESRAFLVEGYTDCITMTQHGFINTIATLGTACTAAHLKQLSRLAPYLYILYDSDQAGHNAVLRLTELCWQAHMELKVIALPDNQDPDSFLKAGNDLATYIEKAQDIFVFFIESVARDLPNQTVHQKVQTARKLIDIIRPIDDALKRDMLLQKAANTFDVPFESLKREMSESPHAHRTKTNSPGIGNQKADQKAQIKMSSLEKRIGSAILNNVGLLKNTNVSLLRICLEESLARLLDAIVLVCQTETFELSAFLPTLEPDLQQVAHQLALEHEDAITPEVFAQLVLQLQKKQWKLLVHQVKLQLTQAKDENNEQRVQEILHDFITLKQTLTPGTVKSTD